jgi:hypothetical protein
VRDLVMTLIAVGGVCVGLGAWIWGASASVSEIGAAVAHNDRALKRHVLASGHPEMVRQAAALSVRSALLESESERTGRVLDEHARMVGELRILVVRLEVVAATMGEP